MRLRNTSTIAPIIPIMRSIPPSRRKIRKTPTAFLLFLLILPLTACRRQNAAEQVQAPPVIAPELSENQLASSPGNLLSAESNAPVHWQTPEPETLRRAKDARRPIFAFVGMPQSLLTHTALEAIYRNGALVESLNRDFVPVLVDADVCREIGLLTVPLCAELKKPTTLPMLLWLTSEGNPIAWLPLSSQNPKEIVENVTNAANTVGHMWLESPDYVMNNGRSDNTARSQRLSALAFVPVVQTSANPSSDINAAIRQLATLYDATTHNFDDSGGLFPSGALKLLSEAACYKAIPAFSRDAASKTVGELGGELAASAMIDPLDGGIFLNRVGIGWNMPVFLRGCSQQAQAAIAWMNAGRATHNSTFTAIGLSALSYAEDAYATGNGLFAMGFNEDPEKTADWLWSEESIRSALTHNEAEVFCAVCEISKLGNIPSECDTRRQFFRLNSLAMRTPVAKVAISLGIPAESADALFQSSCRKLSKIRGERLGNTMHDKIPHAASTFRMISAFASAWSATGDPIWRDKALRSIQKAKIFFAEGNRLRYQADHPGKGQNAARAFIYGLGILAALDVSDITLDPGWASWAEDLASTASEHFTDANGAIEECPASSRFVNLPAVDRSMLFDDSSAGLLSIAEARLVRMGMSVTSSLTATVTPLHTSVPSQPILHTDLIEAWLIRLCSPVITLADNAPEALKLAVCRLPTGLVLRSTTTRQTTNPPPSGKARITLPGGGDHLVSSPEELSAILNTVF